MNFQRSLAVLTMVLVYVLIVLGGWIRANNAGLSCPDWPTCYGQWVLTPGQFEALGEVGYSYYEMMLEWTHRFIAGIIVGPAILLMTFLAFRKRLNDPDGFRLALLTLLVLLVQGLLGGLTVLDRNSPWSVALHLGTALILLSLVILAVQRLGKTIPERAGSLFAGLAILLWLLSIATMVTAAITAKSGASLACDAWPSCDGGFFPDLDDPFLRIHYIHRLLAATTGIALLALALWAKLAGYGLLLRKAFAASLLVACQIGFGAIVILSEVTRWSQILHQATGVLLFVLLSHILWLAMRGTKDQDIPALS